MADEEEVVEPAPVVIVKEPDQTDEEPAEEEEEEEPPPVPPKMYMLEFIVDDITLDFCTTKQLLCFGEGRTIIEFKFLDMGPLRICEDDFVPVQKRYLEGCTGTGSIKNGKSILFSLTPEQAENAGHQAILYCDFIKKTDKKEYRLGSCIIRLISMFKELLDVVAEGNQPYYFKHMKDFYRIRDGNNELIGHVYAYIRLSCFNEMIVNKMKKDPSAELDYSTDPSVYQYKYNRSKTQMEDKPIICDCVENKSSTKVCVCPDEFPQKTCPQVYTDNKCIYDCPQTLRPCQDCPPTCGANKAAGKFRTRTPPPLQSSKSKGSKKSGGAKKKKTKKK